MVTYEASISIAAPREAVWRSLADVAEWPDWLPTVASVHALDAVRLQLGARFVLKQPKLRPATWVVTVLEPPRRFVWEARSLGLKMTAEHIVDEAASGANVSLRFSFDGFLGGLLGRLFRATTQSYLAQEAAALKRKAEACS
jgi:carbon monoxide dehydrogenase subunit G